MPETPKNLRYAGRAKSPSPLLPYLPNRFLNSALRAGSTS